MNEDIWIVLAFSLLIAVVFGLLASLIYIINRSNREAIKIVSKTESDEMDMKDILHVDATIITGLLILVSVSSLLPETLEFEYYGFTFTGEAIMIYLALFAIGPFAVSALYVTWKDEDNARFGMRAGFVMLLGTLAYLFS